MRIATTLAILLIASSLVVSAPLQTVPKHKIRAYTMPSTAVKLDRNHYYLGPVGKSLSGRTVYAEVMAISSPERPAYRLFDLIQGFSLTPTTTTTTTTLPPDQSCYGLQADGVKLPLPVRAYFINPSNARGMNETLVAEKFTQAVATWENESGDIIGQGYVVYDTWNPIFNNDPAPPDGLNTITFGNIINPGGAIALNIIYYTLSPNEIVEWDQIYDEVDYDWSVDCSQEDCSGKMDWLNIATHETGHATGLDDLYTPPLCSEQTMWGWSSYGETKQRTIESGDKEGIRVLYG